MSETKTVAEKAAVQFGFKDGDLIQEFGYDEDVDFDLRDALMDHVDSDLLDEEDQEVVDGVLLWWRAEDGDLVDELVDVLATLGEGGTIWLMTPKAGRDGHVSPLDIEEAAPEAGLHVTSSEEASPEWAATRLVMKQVR